MIKRYYKTHHNNECLLVVAVTTGCSNATEFCVVSLFRKV